MKRQYKQKKKGGGWLQNPLYIDVDYFYEVLLQLLVTEASMSKQCGIQENASYENWTLIPQQDISSFMEILEVQVTSSNLIKTTIRVFPKFYAEHLSAHKSKLQLNINHINWSYWHKPVSLVRFLDLQKIKLSIIQDFFFTVQET